MPSVSAALVDIVRDFLVAHQLIRRVFERYRRGELRFAELEPLVGDDENSILYRIKEHCHARFRTRPGDPRAVMRREVLFDLAIGSLFHEAMSLRENLYQLEVYAPRVQELRSQAGDEANGLFREFEKIMASVSQRLEQGLQETEALLDQTRAQLRELLVEHREDGHITRYLLETRERVEQVFEVPLDALLAEIHGDPAAGFALAGRSYLDAGYFEEAECAFGEARTRGGDDPDLVPLSAYARGMRAFFTGDYAKSVDQLAEWAAARSAGDATLVELARAALGRVGPLVSGKDASRVASAAAELLLGLGAPTPAAEKA